MGMTGAGTQRHAVRSEPRQAGRLQKESARSSALPGDLLVEVCELFVCDGHGPARRLLGKALQCHLQPAAERLRGEDRRVLVTDRYPPCGNWSGD